MTDLFETRNTQGCMSYLYRDCANARNPDTTTSVDAKEIRGNALGENNLSGGFGRAEGQIGNVLAGSATTITAPVKITLTPDSAPPAQFISGGGGDAQCDSQTKQVSMTRTETQNRNLENMSRSNGEPKFKPEGSPVPKRLQYPRVPGHKKEGTSKISADSVAKEAKTLREQCLEVLKRKQLTADEVAMYLHRSILSIRPRCSELIALGLVQETSFRRRNLSGHFANVLRASRGNAAAVDCNSCEETGNAL